MHAIPNLSARKSKGNVYYRYRLPDGSYEQLGKDQNEAIQAAIALNEIREKKTRARATGPDMNFLIDEFAPVKYRLTESKNSREGWKIKFNQYKRWMGEKKIAAIDVRFLDELLTKEAPQYDPYRLHRLLLGELFTYAIGRGWRSEADGNPAKALLPPKMARPKLPKATTRITPEQFDAIIEQAPPFLSKAMRLSRLIGMRRADICALQKTAFSDKHLRFIPAKTASLPNPIALSIPMTQDLVALSQDDSGPRNSPFFISKANRRTKDSAEGRVDPTQILPEQLSRAFNAARKKAIEAGPELFEGLTAAQLPSFHEIRSLCAREYEAKGWPKERVQTLLGHGDERTTDIYLVEEDKVSWTEVQL